jgi:hypothetical protein
VAESSASAAKAAIITAVPTIPALPESTIMLVEVGSTAQSTGLPGGEDFDELGVMIETPNQVLCSA